MQRFLVDLVRVHHRDLSQMSNTATKIMAINVQLRRKRCCVVGFDMLFQR